MIETQSILVVSGIWYSGYEPHDMPGSWVVTRYSLKPCDGGEMISDGRHTAMIKDGLLRIISGGEYCAGTMINQNLRDFIVTFDECFHDEYKAGVERGYKGKRKCSNDYFDRQSQAWRDGYRNGLTAKLMKLAE